MLNSGKFLSIVLTLSLSSSPAVFAAGPSPETVKEQIAQLILKSEKKGFKFLNSDAFLNTGALSFKTVFPASQDEIPSFGMSADFNSFDSKTSILTLAMAAFDPEFKNRISETQLISIDISDPEGARILIEETGRSFSSDATRLLGKAKSKPNHLYASVIEKLLPSANAMPPPKSSLTSVFWNTFFAVVFFGLFIRDKKATLCLILAGVFAGWAASGIAEMIEPKSEPNK